MIGCVTMTQAKVQFALNTQHGYQLFFLAAFERAFIGENFRLVRFTVLVNVLTYRHIGRYAAWRWHWFTA